MASLGATATATAQVRDAAASPAWIAQLSRDAQRALQQAERQARREAAEAQRQAQREAAEAVLRTQREAIEAKQRQREASAQQVTESCRRLADLVRNTEGVPAPALARRGAYPTRPTGRGEVTAEQIPFESWLVADERAVPLLGKRYDELSEDELNGYQRAVAHGRCLQVAHDDPGAAAARADAGTLGRLFSPQWAKSHVVPGLQAIRAARTQAAEFTRALTALTPDEDGLRRYREAAAQSQRLAGFLNAAQQRDYEQALAVARQRVVAPVLSARIEAAIATAQGYEGFVALAALSQETRGGELKDAPAAQQLRARQAALAGELAATERRRIDALGSGLVALERGADWHRDYEKRLRRYAGEFRELADLHAYFMQQRATALAAARDDLGRRIGQAQSEDELSQIVARYLPLEADQRSPEGTALMTRVAESREALERRRILARNPQPSPQSPSQSQSQPQPVAATSRPAARSESATGEPSEGDMYDAIKAELDSRNAGLRELAGRCERREFRNDPVLAMQCLQLCGGTGGTCRMSVKITRFQKLGCAPASGQPGYICDYVVGIDMSGGTLPESLRAMMSGGAAQGRFLRQQAGWLFLPQPRRN